MEISSAAVLSSSSSSLSPLSIFSPSRTNLPTPRHLRFPISSKPNNHNESDLQSDPNPNPTSIVPLHNNQFLSKDAAMGLVLSAAGGKGGWTTGSGMEGPPAPVETGTENISTFPWSLFTKSPRRRMLVAFTCNICGQRTTRAINPHAYNDGTVFVQTGGSPAESLKKSSAPAPATGSPNKSSAPVLAPATGTNDVWKSMEVCCGCNVFHKLVDNLNLFHDMKCYVLPTFNYTDAKGDVSFKFLDMDGDDDMFPIL